MRGAFRSEPKFLAVFTNVDARRYSVRTQIPGVNYQVGCEVFSWREPNFLAKYPRLNAGYLSVRTKIPSSTSQFEREAPFGQNQDSWRYFSVGPETLGDYYQFEREVLFG